MANINVECIVCGGTEFHIESGYYYCNECQTQTQEIQEHVFQDELQNFNVKSTRKVPKQDDKANENKKITSWQCWNIVMLKLTDELIILGANKKLKEVVRFLWMKYLEKLQVLHIHENRLPRLQVVNCKRDYNILTGKKRKKRSRTKSTSDDSTTTTTTLNTSSLKRLRTRRKRALVQSEYESFSQKSTQGSSSLHNETLTSLKSSGDEEPKRRVSYNKYAEKEFKRYGKRHHKVHEDDPEFELRCHTSYRNCTGIYQSSAYILSKNKLYCILYLGLLIIEDKIQLGDMLRFIREGHMSFDNYMKLFPEEYQDKYLNLSNARRTFFSNRCFRMTAAKLVKMLKVDRFIKLPNLQELSRRFCQELNLPDIFYVRTKNILLKSSPKLQCNNRTTILPNYEGRVMSIILFNLKLLFGFDGETEQEFSKFAQVLNGNPQLGIKMFDVVLWMKHLEYRKLLISQHHFPTQYLIDPVNIDSDSYVQHVLSKDIIQQDEQKKLSKEMEDYKHLLDILQQNQRSIQLPLQFPPSLLPFFSYNKILLNNPEKIRDCMVELLEVDFTKSSLDFLLKPNQYLRLLKVEDDSVKNGGANDNFVISPIENPKCDKKSQENSDRSLVTVGLVDKASEENIKGFMKRPEIDDIENRSKLLLEYHQKKNSTLFQKNRNHLEKLSEPKVEPITIENQIYKVHYNPYERYWFNLRMSIDASKRESVEDFLKTFPSNFQLVFNECCRILEQNPQELLQEFQMTEMYLAFVAMYNGQGGGIPKCQQRLRTFVKQAGKNW